MRMIIRGRSRYILTPRTTDQPANKGDDWREELEAESGDRDSLLPSTIASPVAPPRCRAHYKELWAKIQ